MGIPTLISTATASNASSVAITSGIDSTYDEYMFLLINIIPATDDVQFEFNASDDTSSWSYDIVKTTTVFTAWHAAADDTAGLSYQAGYDLVGSTAYQRIMASLSNDADEAGSGILHLFAPSSTTYVKNFYLRTESNHYGARETDYFAAGYFNTTAAITALDFRMTSGNFDGIIQMYGIA